MRFAGNEGSDTLFIEIIDDLPAKPGAARGLVDDLLVIAADMQPLSECAGNVVAAAAMLSANGNNHMLSSFPVFSYGNFTPRP